MPALVGGLGYDRGFARALVETAEPLQGTFTQAGQRRLKALQNGLSLHPSAEAEAALLTELEAEARHWPDDGCAAERRAILALRCGQLLYRQERWTEALEQYELAAKELPEEGEVLRWQLGERLYDLASTLFGCQERSVDVYSKAERILRKVVSWFPSRFAAWYLLGAVLDKMGKHEEASGVRQRVENVSQGILFDCPEDLDAWLVRNGIDTQEQEWGHGEAKTVENLWHEIIVGESRIESGPLRQVEAVKVIIRNSTRDHVLTEVKQEFDNGERPRNFPPSKKMQIPGETWRDAATHCLQKEMEDYAHHIQIVESTYEKTSSKEESKSYPGLRTRYTFHTVEVRAPEVPDRDFWTPEFRSGKNPVTKHYWVWKPESDTSSSL